MRFTGVRVQASNVRLKQLLGELNVARQQATQASDGAQSDSRMTMGELTRKVEFTLMSVLDERFRDEAFTSAITEQSSLASVDKVRVEFEGDEVFWALQDNYSFEMLLQDAARYWDVASQDVILVDERGAIWPNDAYIQLETQRNPTLKIALKIKPVAIAVEEDVEMYGREGEVESDDDDDDFDQGVMAIAAAAEDELLLAQAKGSAAKLTTKQKLGAHGGTNRNNLHAHVRVLSMYNICTCTRGMRPCARACACPPARCMLEAGRALRRACHLGLPSHLLPADFPHPSSPCVDH